MVTRFLLLAGAAIAAPAGAQVANPVGTVAVPPSQPAPTPTPTPVPSPAVPAIAPPPIVTTVTPTPTPTASEEAPPPRRRATAPRSAPRAAPVPIPSATPTAAAPTPAPIPRPAAAPSPTPAPPPVPAEAAERGLPFWAVPAGLVALLLLGAAVYAWRRRTPESPPEEIAYEPESPPVAPTLPLARDAAPHAPPADAPQFLEPVAPLAPRAALAVTLVPRRAGVNLLTATADVEITIVNEGDGPAAEVRVGAQLTSAQPGQDDALGALFAAPIARPAAPPFALAPGETRTVRTLMTLAREAIVVLTAADRPMFVPVVAINVTYRRSDGQAGQTAAAFAVGVEREGSAKLAPFWLDGASRMHDRLAARPHALALRS